MWAAQSVSKHHTSKQVCHFFGIVFHTGKENRQTAAMKLVKESISNKWYSKLQMQKYGK